MASRRPRKTQDQWQTVIQRFEQSGQSARTFCEQEDVAFATFQRWRRQFTLSEVTQESASGSAFAAVKTTPPETVSPIGSVTTVQLGSQITLTIRHEY